MDINIKDNFNNINSKFGLIILQNFLYFVSLLSLLYVLFKKYSYQNIFSIIGIAFFLSFEPTLNQWNRILYSESIFFSFQIILLAILISYDEHSTYKTSIIIGVLVSLMYLQRSISIYYLIIIFFYFYVFFRKKFAINLLIIITIYTLTHIFIGFSNYKRDGKLYFMPILAKEDLYGYFIPKILKYHKDENFVSNFETRLIGLIILY